MTELYMVGIVLVIVVGYVGSLWINPWVKCSWCGGASKKKGFLFGYAHHSCRKCKGTGQRLRFGRKLIFGPPKSSP